jgi:hypothetical protein
LPVRIRSASTRLPVTLTTAPSFTMTNTAIDLTRQILAGDGGQQGEERMQNSAHFGTVVRRLNLLKIIGNQSFLTPLEGWPKYPDSAPLPTATTPPQLGTARLVRR